MELNCFNPCAECEFIKPPVTELLDLDRHRRSPNRGAGASRPKRNYTSPQGEIYFKFGLTKNEICAELFAYDLAKQLGIDVAETRLAKSAETLGVASYDIGEHDEPKDDVESYSVKDYIGLDGFVSMCLFDYLIMNEDRHARNWGIVKGKVAPLFDHNYAFGGPDGVSDADNFMRAVTSPFYVINENNQRHDTILLYFVKYHMHDVSLFIQELKSIRKVSNTLLEKHLANECKQLNKILFERIRYMQVKVGDFSERQIDDNEF